MNTLPPLTDIYDLVAYCHIELPDQVILHLIAQTLKLFDSLCRETCSVPRDRTPCAREYPFWVV